VSDSDDSTHVCIVIVWKTAKLSVYCTTNVQVRTVRTYNGSYLYIPASTCNTYVLRTCSTVLLLATVAS
jgi:hypothetical protein